MPYLAAPGVQYVSLTTLRLELVGRRKGLEDPYGLVDRKTLDDYLAQPFDDLPHDVQRMLPLWTKSKRDALVDAFNKVAVFLLSDAASYVTGQITRVDGGMIRSI